MPSHSPSFAAEANPPAAPEREPPPKFSLIGSGAPGVPQNMPELAAILDEVGFPYTANVVAIADHPHLELLPLLLRQTEAPERGGSQQVVIGEDGSGSVLRHTAAAATGAGEGIDGPEQVDRAIRRHADQPCGAMSLLPPGSSAVSHADMELI